MNKTCLFMEGFREKTAAESFCWKWIGTTWELHSKETAVNCVKVLRQYIVL